MGRNYMVPPSHFSRVSQQSRYHPSMQGFSIHKSKRIDVVPLEPARLKTYETKCKSGIEGDEEEEKESLVVSGSRIETSIKCI